MDQRIMDDFFLDLGAMSDAKQHMIESVDRSLKHDCDHPLTSHTGTEATWPWKVCAHRPCPCKVMVD